MKIYCCIYNKENQTLRIEPKGAKLLPGDNVVFYNDIVTIKVFIYFICDSYPQIGSNATHLEYYEIKRLYNDINSYMEAFDKIASDIDFDDLVFNEHWRVD